MTVSLSLRGRSLTLPDRLVYDADCLSEAVGPFGVGFTATTLAIEFGIWMFGPLYLAIAAYGIGWSDSVDGDEFKPVFKAFVAFPVISGCLVAIGLYRIGAFIILLDYWLYFHEFGPDLEETDLTEGSL